MKDDYKIAFVQEERRPQNGIMGLSAFLKPFEFSTEVFSLQIDGKDAVDNILKMRPDLIACSVMTPGYRRMVKAIDEIKARRPDAFVVMGGAHTTFFPDVICQEKNIDAICIGEGEHAMIELANSLRSGNPDTSIRNLWIRDGGNIIRNSVRNLIDDLDTLPFPDRDLYFQKYPVLIKEMTWFMIGRGCPFSCSYCFNKGMKELYKGKGSWLRFRTSGNIIEEIKQVNKKYPMRWLSFVDDTFNADKKLLKEFLDIYKREIDIPFLCQLRIDMADEEQIELLKQAGVERIAVGIEHGDENFRKTVLNRDMTNKKILEFAGWVNKRKIRLQTQNIIGFPGETLKLAFSTVELNTRIKPELANSNILAPYPGTDIYKYAKEKGYLRDNFCYEKIVGHTTVDGFNARIRSEIKNERINELINIRCFFMVLVRHPWLRPIVKLLIKLPYNIIYELIWQVTGSFRISWRFADWNGRKALLKKLLLLFKTRTVDI